MRRGVSLVEALVALAVGGLALVVALELFNGGGRLFGRVQGTLDIEGDARLALVNLTRDLSEAHRLRPAESGDSVRLVRFLPDAVADFASRTDEAYVNGTAGERSFAAQEVTYRLDTTKRVVTRRETPGLWRWTATAVRFTPSGATASREVARNVTRLAVELLGYDAQGQLDLITGLSEADLPYAGPEARHAAAALALVRVTAALDTPAREADAPRDLDVVTKVWLEGRRADGLARPFLTSADERRE